MIDKHLQKAIDANLQRIPKSPRCRKCKSTNLAEYRYAGNNIHTKCNDCGQVLYFNSTNETPSNPLNYCGDPKHYENGEPINR